MNHLFHARTSLSILCLAAFVSVQCAGGFESVKVAEEGIADRCFKVETSGGRPETDDSYFCLRADRMDTFSVVSHRVHDILWNSAEITWLQRTPDRWVGHWRFLGHRIDTEVSFTDGHVRMEDTERRTGFERVNQMVSGNLHCLTCPKDQVPPAVDRSVMTGRLLDGPQKEKIESIMARLPSFYDTCSRLDSCLDEVSALSDKGARITAAQHEMYADANELGLSGLCESMREVVFEDLAEQERRNAPSCRIEPYAIDGLTVDASPGVDSPLDKEMRAKIKNGR